VLRGAILYSSLSIPVLFAWILVPHLMLETGLSVAEAGAVLTIASGVAALANIIVGRLLDKAEPVVFIAAIMFVEGAAYAIYTYGFLKDALLAVVLAAVVERLARGFYPVFAVYEYDVYPEEIREKAFALHNLLPYLVQLLTYPAIGYAIAVLLDDVTVQAGSLAFFAAASTALGVLALLWLPRIGARRLEVSQPLLARIPRAYPRMVLAVLAFSVSFEFCQPLIVANLFIMITDKPLLGLALYETFMALPAVMVSYLVLHVGRERGVYAITVGMLLIALADIMLGFSQNLVAALLAATVLSTGYSLMSPFFMDTLFSTIPGEGISAPSTCCPTARWQSSRTGSLPACPETDRECPTA